MGRRRRSRGIAAAGISAAAPRTSSTRCEAVLPQLHLKLESSALPVDRVGTTSARAFSVLREGEEAGDVAVAAEGHYSGLLLKDLAEPLEPSANNRSGACVRAGRVRACEASSSSETPYRSRQDAPVDTQTGGRSCTASGPPPERLSRCLVDDVVCPTRGAGEASMPRPGSHASQTNRFWFGHLRGPRGGIGPAPENDEGGLPPCGDRDCGWDRCGVFGGSSQ